MEDVGGDDDMPLAHSTGHFLLLVQHTQAHVHVGLGGRHLQAAQLLFCHFHRVPAVAHHTRGLLPNQRGSNPEIEQPADKTVDLDRSNQNHFSL